MILLQSVMGGGLLCLLSEFLGLVAPLDHQNHLAGGEVNMKSCPFCKAPLKRKTIEHVHRWGGRLFLFKNIRAEVCSQCGETFLKPAVLRLMDKCTSSGKVGKVRVSIPVISVPLKVSA